MDLILSIDCGLKNLAICAIRPGPDPHGRDDRIEFWTVTSTLPGVYALMDSLRDAGVVDLLPRVKEVAIERQVTSNIKMCRLMCHLEMFFAMSGKFVHLADSRGKLDFAAASPWWPGSIPDNWSYHTRKKLSVQSTRAYLAGTAQSDEARATFASSSKLDDLGDCLLQGLAYIHFVAPLQNAKAQAKRSKVPAPRRPSAKQLAGGKLAKSHVVHFVREAPGSLDSLAALEKACEAFKPLKRGVLRHFGSMAQAFTALTESPAFSRKAAREGKGVDGRDFGPSPGPSAAVPSRGLETHGQVEPGVLPRGGQDIAQASGDS